MKRNVENSERKVFIHAYMKAAMDLICSNSTILPNETKSVKQESNVCTLKYISLEYFNYLVSAKYPIKECNGDISTSALISVNTYNKLLGNEDLCAHLECLTPHVTETCNLIIKSFNIKCIPVSLVTDDLCLYVTNEKYYNISRKLGVKNLSDLKFSFTAKEKHKNPVASKIRLKHIESGGYFKTDELEKILKEHFKTPKNLMINDIFSVNFQKLLPNLCDHIEYKNVTNVYFHVLDAEIPKCDNTANAEFSFNGIIELKPAGPEFLPPIYTKFVRFGMEAGEDISICPAGLNDYALEVEKLIRVFLNGGIEKLRPMILMYGMRGSGKKTVLKCVAAKLGLKFRKFNCFDLIRSDDSSFENKLSLMFSKSAALLPAIYLLENVELLGRDETLQDDIGNVETFKDKLENLFCRASGYPLIVVGTCNQKIPNLMPDVERLFHQRIAFKSLNRTKVENLLNWLVKEARMTCPGNVVTKVAERLSGYLFADITTLMKITLKHHMEESTVSRTLTYEHFEKAIGIIENNYSQSIGSVKVPTVQWDDVGGLENLKDEINMTLNFPINYPELSSAGLRASGFLFYGPPGTGKTLVAKAIATEFNCNFLSVKGPELINMYVGQSEKNVREVFERAREAAPCVLFFDELDSLAPNRGRESSPVMDRIVSQLLTEMDGLDSNNGVFVIGATNRPDLVDPGLLRPGRFDKSFYVGVCTDTGMKLKVLKALTRRFKLDGDVQLHQIADKIQGQVTGADIYSICTNSWLEAARRYIRDLEKGEVPELPVKVSMDDFGKAVSEFVSSLTPEIIESYQKYQSGKGN